MIVVNAKFSFDFLLSTPRKSGQLVVKAVRINAPKCLFLGSHVGLILRTFFQRQKITAICRAVYRNELYTSILNSGNFLEPVARN